MTPTSPRTSVIPGAIESEGTEPGSVPSTPWWAWLAAAVGRRVPMGRYRLMNAVCRNLGSERPVVPFVARLPRDLGAARFICDPRDVIAREAWFCGGYEAIETRLVRHWLGPGATFVDVGANWGYFSLIAGARVGPHGRVVALEPDPRVFARLTLNRTLNPDLAIEPLALAASDQAGVVRLQGHDETGDNFGLSRLVLVADERGIDDQANDPHAPPTFQANAIRLDDLFDQLGLATVDLIKIDIEGAEALALRGLERTLRSGRARRLLLELHPLQLVEFGSSMNAVMDWLHGLGWRGWAIADDPQARRRASYGRDRHESPKAGLKPIDPIRATERDDDSSTMPWPHQVWLPPV